MRVDKMEDKVVFLGSQGEDLDKLKAVSLQRFSAPAAVVAEALGGSRSWFTRTQEMLEKEKVRLEHDMKELVRKAAKADAKADAKATASEAGLDDMNSQCACFLEAQGGLRSSCHTSLPTGDTPNMSLSGSGESLKSLRTLLERLSERRSNARVGPHNLGSSCS
jgi:hypothetical protein